MSATRTPSSPPARLRRLPARPAAAAQPLSPPTAPPVSIRHSGTDTLPAYRLIELHTADGTRVGHLSYHLSAEPHLLLQLLDIHVHPAHRRLGLGQRLFDLALSDARTLIGPDHKLRRCFTLVPHKAALQYRALLTRLGFHHTSTITGLCKGEDLLMYTKSYT